MGQIRAVLSSQWKNLSFDGVGHISLNIGRTVNINYSACLQEVCNFNKTLAQGLAHISLTALQEGIILALLYRLTTLMSVHLDLECPEAEVEADC